MRKEAENDYNLCTLVKINFCWNFLIFINLFNIQREILKPQEVLPLGFSAESVLRTIVNKG